MVSADGRYGSRPSRDKAFGVGLAFDHERFKPEFGSDFERVLQQRPAHSMSDERWIKPKILELALRRGTRNPVHTGGLIAFSRHDVHGPVPHVLLGEREDRAHTFKELLVIAPVSLGPHSELAETLCLAR